MAKNKIERIDQEITKVREKIAEYQEKGNTAYICFVYIHIGQYQ